MFPCIFVTSKTVSFLLIQVVKVFLRMPHFIANSEFDEPFSNLLMQLVFSEIDFVLIFYFKGNINLIILKKNYWSYWHLKLAMDPKLKDTSYIKIFRSLDLLTSFLLPIRKPVHRYVVCVKLVVELLLGSWEKEGTARFAETIFY